MLYPATSLQAPVIIKILHWFPHDCIYANWHIFFCFILEGIGLHLSFLLVLAKNLKTKL